MLLVDPEAVIAADHAVDVKHGGMNEAADAKHAAELALGQAVFEAMHGNSEFRTQNAELTRVCIPKCIRFGECSTRAIGTALQFLNFAF